VNFIAFYGELMQEKSTNIITRCDSCRSFAGHEQ